MSQGVGATRRERNRNQRHSSDLIVHSDVLFRKADKCQFPMERKPWFRINFSGAAIFREVGRGLTGATFLLFFLFFLFLSDFVAVFFSSTALLS